MFLELVKEQAASLPGSCWGCLAPILVAMLEQVLSLWSFLAPVSQMPAILNLNLVQLPAALPNISSNHGSLQKFVEGPLPSVCYTDN